MTDGEIRATDMRALRLGRGLPGAVTVDKTGGRQVYNRGVIDGGGEGVP